MLISKLVPHNRAGYKQPETLKGAQTPRVPASASSWGPQSRLMGPQEEPGWFLFLPRPGEALWQSGCNTADTDTGLLRPTHANTIWTLSTIKQAGVALAHCGQQLLGTRGPPWAAFKFPETGRLCFSEELCAWPDNFSHKIKPRLNGLRICWVSSSVKTVKHE